MATFKTHTLGARARLQSLASFFTFLYSFFNYSIGDGMECIRELVDKVVFK